MLNNSPWLWNARKTAAGMTARTSNDRRILQGRRAKGQSNPSPQYIQAQGIAGVIWGIWHQVSGFIKSNWGNIAPGLNAANEWFKLMYEFGFDKSGAPDFTNEYDGWNFANGSMTLTEPTTLTAVASTSVIHIDWNPAVADGSQNANDVAWYVIFDRDSGRSITGSLPGARSTGASGIIAGDTLLMTAGDHLDAYLSFTALPTEPNAGMQSRSGYITAVVS